MLQITGYTKYYGPQLVLEIPSLKLDNELYWVKGNNGAGKTTFLKSVAGLLPFNGNIFFDQFSLKKQRQFYLNEVSFAEAEPQYPPFLTGSDMIRFFRQVRKDNTERTGQLVTRFQMKEFIDAKLATYSSGMMKKLSLVLALLGEPKLILLDEPFITLDTEAVTSVTELIHEFRMNGIGFLMSTHQQPSAGFSYKTLLIQNNLAELI